MLRSPRLPDLRLALLDMGRKTKIARYRPALADSQWFSRDRLEELQLKKLKDLLAFASDRVPFYRKLLQDKGLGPDALNHRADLAAWPVVAKPLMRSNPEDFRPTGASLEGSFKRRTGGSTGDPFEYRVGMTAFSMQWAALFRAWEWSGYRLGIRW